MTNVDLVYQALVIHPKWMRFTNAQDPVMTGRRWYGSWMPMVETQFFWINDTSRTVEKSQPHNLICRHLRSTGSLRIAAGVPCWGGPYFFGGQDIVVAPPGCFFGGFQRRGGPKLSSCRRTPTGYAFWKGHRPRKRGYPDFIIKLWNIWKIPPNSHGWKMLKTSSSPSLYRIELHHIVGLSPILWEKPMSYGCSCVGYSSISHTSPSIIYVQFLLTILDHFTHRKTHGVPKLWLVTSIFCWFCPMTHPRVIIILIVSP